MAAYKNFLNYLNLINYIKDKDLSFKEEEKEQWKKLKIHLAIA